ncbi:hypothetical protein CDAR_551371 [Caerostris darwini]|uniref:Uncharacterized protein n=1 Tax=Caerostris darwini TaxID=1538125 RepID=A0AAV4V5U2_9ARAC|nr:hypothetical protein CDAR_551371 [Caerostris darwini]
MLMNKTIRVPLRTSPCSPNYLHVPNNVFPFSFDPYPFLVPGKKGESRWKGKQYDFHCEEIANDFSGTWVISLSGKREKRGTAANYWRKAGDMALKASDWVTEGDPAGTMDDRCPLIGSHQRRFPPFVGWLLFLS